MEVWDPCTVPVEKVSSQRRQVYQAHFEHLAQNVEAPSPFPAVSRHLPTKVPHASGLRGGSVREQKTLSCAGQAYSVSLAR